MIDTFLCAVLLAITICATRNYTYAMAAQARRVAANVIAARIPPGIVILVGDESPALVAVHALYEALLPEGWKIIRITNKAYVEGGENYKEHAQMLIAAMRSDAFAAARKLGADQCWSLDSDTLPPANALRCLRTMLEFDDGYYSISTCPYPNGAFLGGRGTPQNPIAEDFLPHERLLPWKLQRALAANERRLNPSSVLSPPSSALPPQSMEREVQRRARLLERARACPLDGGSIWGVIAKHGWRRRGWLENAYPGIGRGAIVPSDWCGFGCTLLNREALALAHFEGYEGKGTEDLFIIWQRWHPAGLRINVIPHAACDHIIWEKKKNGNPEKYTLLQAYHETEGECVGHLRVRAVPWSPEVHGQKSSEPRAKSQEPEQSGKRR